MSMVMVEYMRRGLRCRHPVERHKSKPFWLHNIGPGVLVWFFFVRNIEIIYVVTLCLEFSCWIVAKRYFIYISFSLLGEFIFGKIDLLWFVSTGAVFLGWHSSFGSALVLWTSGFHHCSTSCMLQVLFFARFATCRPVLRPLWQNN